MKGLRHSTSSMQNSQNNQSMHSTAGASFQEYALSMLDFKGSPAHKAIGGLVMAINCKRLSIEQAKAKYHSLLSNQ
jgi:hypothetical protein